MLSGSFFRDLNDAPNMKYIESFIANNIDLLRIILGDIEYKNSLQPIFDIESLKKDSNDFQNFITHEIFLVC